MATISVYSGTGRGQKGQTKAILAIVVASQPAGGEAIGYGSLPTLEDHPAPIATPAFGMARNDRLHAPFLWEALRAGSG